MCVVQFTPNSPSPNHLVFPGYTPFLVQFWRYASRSLGYPMVSLGDAPSWNQPPQAGGRGWALLSPYARVDVRQLQPIPKHPSPGLPLPRPAAPSGSLGYNRTWQRLSTRLIIAMPTSPDPPKKDSTRVEGGNRGGRPALSRR